ncbi:hypothetical protein IM511_08060 [Erythrobacteraceae bacterium E2-1 Yellow Sea]|nr:hypothetical protein [Erythrobacteraceae bacterium E2-1 Yellow Sea]
MTATIIAFPDTIARADREFKRTGQTDYTRALDASQTLYAQAAQGVHDPVFEQQFAFLTSLIERLQSSRPEMLDELVILNDGNMKPLRNMVAVINQMQPKSAMCALN